MRFLIPLIILFLMVACTNSAKQEIIVPKLHSGFYQDALSQINNKLKSDPSNTNLLEQKIFYCDQLGWPITCISALDQFKAKFGMTIQLADQYIAYYEVNERYQLLLDLIDRWNEEFALNERFQRSLIKSLVETRNSIRAKKELKVFLIKNQSADDLAFASVQYMSLHDTLMTAYTLSKLQKKDDSHMLMFEYGKLLVAMGFNDRGFNVLKNYLDQVDPDFNKSLEVARLYESEGEWGNARNTIKAFAEQDTVAYLIADWYKQDLLWDSAIMYIDVVLVRDSTNSKAWWKKGRLYEDRSWLSSSLQYFEKMLEINEFDSVAINRIDQIQRKIAYLQRQKFEELKVPILNLEPIKIKN